VRYFPASPERCAAPASRAVFGPGPVRFARTAPTIRSGCAGSVHVPKSVSCFSSCRFQARRGPLRHLKKQEAERKQALRLRRVRAFFPLGGSSKRKPVLRAPVMVDALKDTRGMGTAGGNETRLDTPLKTGQDQ